MKSKLTKISEFEEWLETFTNFERAPDRKMFKLETTQKLVELFAHPENAYSLVHVAGSKGKGSISKMVASIIDCYLSKTAQAETSIRPAQVGMYASPHVSDFRERCAEAHGFLPDKIYEETITEFTTTLDRLRAENRPEWREFLAEVSWFELVVAFSFLLFRNAKLKYVVCEVGMGGRLDATNIISPKICCISNIELEHTQILGDTLEAIAAEKAGIIKEGVPVVVAAQASESVREVFRSQAAKLHAPIYFVDDYVKISEVNYTKNRMHIKLEGEYFARPIETDLQLLGPAQAKNAALAALAAKILLPDLSETEIETGLAAAKLPGRFEIRDNLILDAAHTKESVAQSLEVLTELYPGKKINLLFGLAAGKDAKSITALFKDKFNQIFVTKPGDFKVSDLPSVVQAFKDNQITISQSDPDFVALIQTALATSKAEDAILYTVGSFYLLDEVIKVLS